MPGLCLRYDADDPPDPASGSTAAVRREDHTYQQVSGHEHCALGYTTYPSYPTTTRSTGDSTVYFEGYCYDADDRAAAIDALGTAVLAGDDETIDRWLDRDGEFLVAAVEDATGEGAVLTDSLGRLPTYYHHADGSLVASREIHYLLDAGEPGFDRLGIAQQLLFGYALGDRTLWEDVHRLPPGTVLRFGQEGVTLDRHARFDYGTDRHADRSVAENATALVDRFRTACRDRTREGSETVVSLSGGLDSRAALLGFHAESLPVATATFTAADDPEVERDATIAGDLADALDLDWRLFEVSGVDEGDAATVLSLKAGLNHCKMGFILAFFEEIRDAYGADLTYVTGDGGDKALPDIRPTRSFSSLDDLASFAVEQNRVFDPTEAAAIAGVDEATLVESVADRLADYPESSLRDRYVHFLVAERGRNWLFEGEDRNRYYFWSTTPFYSLPFFRYAMNVPAEQKAGNRLYEAFLEELWPRATDFRDAQFDATPGSAKYALLQRGLALSDRFPRLARLGRRLYKGDGGGSTAGYAAVLRDQYTSVDAVDDWLSPMALRRVADSPDDYDPMAFATLLTVTGAIGLTGSAEPVLDRRPNRVIES